ncbi:MAG: hypothetical protein A2359_01375 [Candidatus Moranbacteria bacterium RIFOXYB1_FULL_43_19]|nr:MAG: hypothetical protein A2359_01375 [Candidatus Moranbacteria bacterium RIFOXYB1_FULL_43_19]OGI28917.1 MAG: hypothetical protein A2184_01005 [Candidatus Moranbacteria bacterium RIFOXYA1_FULL_44_7]OGI38378.1 MAG: hypothetical protein A2612_02590 [Candidatus Moranbacteria bacterium RIFOXYD1_FULL_44_12]
MNEVNKNSKKQIPFIDILKQSARIVWQNKFLLWFGVLLALGSPGSFNIGNSEDWSGKGDAAKNFMEAHWQLVIAIGLILFAIGIALFLISLIGKAGLVRSVNLIAQNKKTNFRQGWKAGKKYLWNLFKLFLIIFFATIIIVLVLAIPVIFLAVKGSWLSAIAVGLLAVAIFIPLAFVLAITNIFAEFYIILSEIQIWSAVESGYNLLLKNIKNSLIFSLLILAVNIAAGIVLLPVLGVALLILVPSGMLFYHLNKVVFGIFLFFAILLFVAFALFVSSIFLTYKTTAWTLFFREIAKVESEEAAKVLEEESEKEIAAAPEKA